MSEIPAGPSEPEPTDPEPAPVPDVPAAPPLPEGMATAGASNQSPVLPPSAQVSAARAHAALGHLISVARTVQADLERYIPAAVLSAAETEVQAAIRGLL